MRCANAAPAPWPGRGRRHLYRWESRNRLRAAARKASGPQISEAASAPSK